MKAHTHLLLLMTSLFMSMSLGAQTFPQVSEETDFWYSIYSHRSGKVINNAGLGQKATSADFVAGQDNLQWKFQLVSKGEGATPDTFKIVSKTGGEFVYVDYMEVAPGEGKYVWDDDADDGKGGYVELTPDDIDAGAQGTHNLLSRFVTKEEGEGNRFVFTTFGSDESGFQFQIKEADMDLYLNMTNPGDGSDYTVYNVNNDGGNPFSVIKNSMDEIEAGLDELYKTLFTDAPALSTSASPVWYQIKNLRKARVFTVNADGAIKLEPSILEAGTELNAQLFRFEGTLRSFKIICKTGGALKYDTSSSLIVKTDGDGEAFKVDRMTAGTYNNKLVIIHVPQNQGVNGMHSFDVGLYDGTTDDGNAVEFVAEGYDPFAKAPALSTADAPVYYFLKNVRSGNVIYYNEGAGQIHQEAIAITGSDERDAQLFRLEGSYTGGFKLVAKVGGNVLYNAESGRFDLSEDDGSSFKLIEKDAEAGTWNIQYENSANGMNAHNTNLSEVTIYSTSDAGSVWTFIDEDYDPYENAPELSSEATPVWYQFKNTRSGKALCYNTEAGQIYTGEEVNTAGEEQDLQLFRLEGSYTEGFEIVAKVGGKIVYNVETGRFNLTEEGGTPFTLLPKDETAGTWNILYEGNNGINAHNTKVEEVGLYAISDPGSVWQFVKPEGSLHIDAVKNNLRTKYSLSGNALTVQAEQMRSVVVYNMTGAIIISSDVVSNRFDSVISERGCYILSVTFNDATAEHIKFIVK